MLIWNGEFGEVETRAVLRAGSGFALSAQLTPYPAD